MNNCLLFIGETRIYALRGKYKNKTIELEKVSLSDLPINIYEIDYQKQSEELNNKLNEQIKNIDIASEPLTIVIPDAQAYTRVIEMPMLTEAELISSIKYQADQFVPLPIKDVNIDLDIIYKDKTNNKLLVLFTACSKSNISKIQSLGVTLGLTLDRIVPEQIVFFEFLDNENLSSDDTIYINMGVTSSTFSFFTKNNGFIYDIYTVKYGSDLIAKDLQRNLSIPYLDSIELVNKSLNLKPETYKDIYNIVQLPVKEFCNHILQYISSIQSKYGRKVKNIYVHGESSSNVDIIKLIQFFLPNYSIEQFILPINLDNKIIEQQQNNLSAVSTVLGSFIT